MNKLEYFRLAINLARRNIHMASGEAMYYIQLTYQDYKRQNLNPYSFKKSLESLNNDIRIRIHCIEGKGDSELLHFNNRIISVTFCYEIKREINGIDKIYAVNCREHERSNCNTTHDDYDEVLTHPIFPHFYPKSEIKFF